MVMTAARRYASSRFVEMQAPIMAALSDRAINVTAICRKLGRSTDDSSVRYCLKRLAADDVIDCEAAPRAQLRTGITYLYRRKS